MPGTPDTGGSSTVLAFDFGRRRIGVAVGQDVTGSASPLGVVGNGDRGPDWPAIEKLLAEWRPDRLIVGLPRNVDGSPSELAGEVRDFRAALGRFAVPVELVDERYTSLEAAERLAGERRDGLRGRLTREMVDAAAAVQIAERWFTEGANR